METPETALPRIETLRAEWTDQFVRVNPERPELRRFGDIVGRVITVNFNGKALVDFQDGGWYDITAGPQFAGKVPILGVCLGHQCIGHVFGGEVVRNDRVMHGKTSPIFHDDRGLFAGLSNPFEATRYHSLVIRRDSFHHPDFEVCAWTAEGEIMGVRHKTWPLHGVQFHPESFLTAEGPKLLRNFLEMKPAD